MWLQSPSCRPRLACSLNEVKTEYLHPADCRSGSRPVRGLVCFLKYVWFFFFFSSRLVRFMQCEAVQDLADRKFCQYSSRERRGWGKKRYSMRWTVTLNSNALQCWQLWLADLIGCDEAEILQMVLAWNLDFITILLLIFFLSFFYFGSEELTMSPFVL